MRRERGRPAGRRRGSVRWNAAAALALLAAACGWEPPPPSGGSAQVVAGSGGTGTGSGGQDTGSGGQVTAAGGTQTPTTAAASDGAPSGYTLTWKDEFDGTALDTNSWTIVQGARRDAQNVADAVSVHDGMLTVTTYTASGQQRTGFVVSQDKVMVKYGYIAAKIRLGASPGVWCAFWLMSPTVGTPLGDPATAGAEIDVLENRVVDQNGAAVGDLDVANVNWDGYGADHKDLQKIASPPNGSPSLQGNWHVYAVLWTDSAYTFYLDGIPFWTTTTAVSRRTEDLRFSCEVQNQSWAGDIPAAGYGSLGASTTRMDVDWIHVWEPSS